MSRPVLGLVLLLAACGGDAYDRPGTWQAAGANETNLRAMLVDPAHARQGVAAETARGAAAVSPVQRLRDGRLPPLPMREPKAGSAAPGDGAHGR